MQRVWLYLPLGLFALVTVLMLIGHGKDPSKLESVLIDKPAPDFVLPQLVDSQKQLSREALLGQTYMINFWASWCSGCRVEHPVLMKLAASGQVPVYGINFKDETDAALQWLADYGNPYRINGVDASGRMGIDWGVVAVPETFIVDSRGIIRYKHVGPITQQVLDKTILPLMRRLAAKTS